MILTTSNITGAIDLAFVDRADIKQYIGMPSTEAIYQIYLSCITELMKVPYYIVLHRTLLQLLESVECFTSVTQNAQKMAILFYNGWFSLTNISL